MGFSQVKGKMRKEKRISFGTFCAEYGRVKQKKEAVWNSIQLHDLSGNRTRVYAVRGRRLDRLTNRP